jgi:hypothetical protein
MMRIVHVLSRLEYLYFLRLEFSRWVTDFYEQFALPFETTVEIAKSERIPYPRDPRTGELIVMTSDFVIKTLDGRLVIRSVKPEEFLKDERVRQKLKIEWIYWTKYEHADSWRTISRKHLNPDLDANIEWVWRMKSPSRLCTRAFSNLRPAHSLARALLLETGCTLGEAASRLGSEFGGRAVGTQLLRHFLASGTFPEADFSVRFSLNRELPLLADHANNAASTKPDLRADAA